MAPIPVTGRQALAESFATRPPWIFRHFVTNVVVDVVSPTEARGHGYMLVAYNSGDGAGGAFSA